MPYSKVTQEEINSTLSCDKSKWDNSKSDEFWKLLRYLINNDNNDHVKHIQNDMYMFENIVFPPFRNHFVSQDFQNPEFILKEDFLFWQKGEKKDLKNLVQFTKCTFYNFDFMYMAGATVTFENCNIQGNITFFLSNIQSIYLKNSSKIDTFTIKTMTIDTLDIRDNSIKNLIVDNSNFMSLVLQNLNIDTALINKIFVKHGNFQDINVKIIKDNFILLIENINQFSCNNMNVISANREYFRFFKKFFNEKDDFINYNEMYEKEMESYFKELKIKIKEKKDLISNLQNILVVGFAKYTSIFGKSSLRPFILLIVCSFLNVYFTNDYSLSYLFSGCGNLWKQIFQSVYFFDKETLTPLRAIFNILQGLLIYQLVVSIKRKIKY